MNKYVVAYVNNFENVLYQKIVEATSERQATLDYLAQCEDIVFDEAELLSMETVDQLVECCFNMDSSISALQID